MRRTEPSWQDYIVRLRDYLADEFDWDDVTRKSFVNHFRTRDFGAGVEWICDQPVVANWRLKPHARVVHDAHPWALRMAYYGNNEGGTDRQDRINDELAVILREETNQ